MATPNALFAVFNISNPEGLKEKMTHIEPWVSLEVQDGQWLLVAPGSTTSKEVSDRLGFSTSDSRDTAIIVRVNTYFGRNFAPVWEWITTKQGAELAITASA